MYIMREDKQMKGVRGCLRSGDANFKLAISLGRLQLRLMIASVAPKTTAASVE
jgi:hypothetical protein